MHEQTTPEVSTETPDAVEGVRPQLGVQAFAAAAVWLLQGEIRPVSRTHLTLVSSNGQRPILVVDDEPTLLRTLKRQLGRWGYWVVTVEAGNRALDLCKSLRPCLVITDLRMPDMDGFELIQKLRAEHGSDAPPMAVLTGATAPLELSNLPRVESVLSKPAPADRLRDLVDRLCHHHRKPPGMPAAMGSQPPDPGDPHEPPDPPLVA